MIAFLPFLILLGVLAAVMREDSIMTIFYLLSGAFALGRWWSTRTLKAVHYTREYSDHAFLGEEILVRLRVQNTSRLPTLWLHLHESLPAELVSPNFFRQVLNLGPGETQLFQYRLTANKRGLYQIGPLFLRSGDLLGLSSDQERRGESQHMVIYPHILPIERLGLPTRSPFGSLRHAQPVYADPSRVSGKRDYFPGDTLRHVDWKSTAAQQRLLVKKFDPAVSLETLIVLDLHSPAYDLRARFNQTELAIVAAASLAAWVTGQGQSVGLVSNGLDPLAQPGVLPFVPVHKGRPHLIRCLEQLARIQAAETQPVEQVLSSQAPGVPWGTTLVLITGSVSQPGLDQLLRAQRAGINPVLLLVGQPAGLDDLRQAVRRSKIAFYHVPFEQDLLGMRS